MKLVNLKITYSSRCCNFGLLSKALSLQKDLWWAIKASHFPGVSIQFCAASERREPLLRKCLHKIGLWAVLYNSLAQLVGGGPGF